MFPRSEVLAKVTKGPCPEGVDYAKAFPGRLDIVLNFYNWITYPMSWYPFYAYICNIYIAINI